MSWFFTIMDFEPIVGTVTRLTQASVLAITGQGDEALDALKGAGMDLAGDIAGVLVLGVGKAAIAGARVAAKVTQAALSGAGRVAITGAEKAAAQTAVRAAAEGTARVAAEGAERVALEEAEKVAAESAEKVAAEEAGTAAAAGVEEGAAKAAAKKSLPRQAWDVVKPNKYDIPIGLGILGVKKLLQGDEEPTETEPPDTEVQPPDGPMDHEDRTTDGPLDLMQPQIPHGATPLVIHTELGDVNVNMGVDLDSLYTTVLHCKCPC